MAAFVTLVRSPSILRTGGLIGTTTGRICLPSLSSKSTPYVVYLSSPSSGYHTKTRARCKLIARHNLSQFSTRPIQRNSSYFTSILQKAFVVNAVEPQPVDIATDLSAPLGESVSEDVNIVSDSSTSFTEPVSEAANIVTDSSASFSEPVSEAANIVTDSSASFSEPVSEATSFTNTSAFATESVVETTFESSVASESISESISYIPPPPAPPEAVVSDSISYIPPPPVPPEAIAQPLNALGEPTIQSLGLGGWSPVGMIQNCLDFLHVTLDLPWWGAIAVATVCIRILIFPLVLTAQRNAAKMNNNLPQLQLLQMKMTEARNSGNQMESARLAQEMMLFMKEKDISPMKNVVVPLAQAPLFISMFVGLRGMANLPLESMKIGGLFWFEDLTLADPYYLLPLVTATTMLATIELGTDGARLTSTNMQNMKWVLRALPILVFPFTINFPTAVLCYWVSTNFFSLIQVGFLKIPAIRDYFKIPRMVNHKPETLPQKKKGMIDGFKESWSNMKVTKELEERERYDEMRFKKAGSGPVVRTFKHDPTRKKVINVQAKVKGRN